MSQAYSKYKILAHKLRWSADEAEQDRLMAEMGDLWVKMTVSERDDFRDRIES